MTHKGISLPRSRGSVHPEHYLFPYRINGNAYGGTYESETGPDNLQDLVEETHRRRQPARVAPLRLSPLRDYEPATESRHERGNRAGYRWPRLARDSEDLFPHPS